MVHIVLQLPLRVLLPSKRFRIVHIIPVGEETDPVSECNGRVEGVMDAP